jgi:hypothetical protein
MASFNSTLAVPGLGGSLCRSVSAGWSSKRAQSPQRPWTCRSEAGTTPQFTIKPRAHFLQA